MELKGKLVRTKELFDHHIKWLEKAIKDDPHSRILETTFRYHSYLAELSSEALLKVRQRIDVRSVGEHADLGFNGEHVKKLNTEESLIREMQCLRVSNSNTITL